MEDKDRYKRPLRRRILFGCSLYIVLVSLVQAFFGGYTYYHETVKRYQEYINGILNYTIAEIDAEDMKKCIEEGTKSISFENTQEVLNKTKEAYDIHYIYIVKPLNTEEVDNMMDVMAGVTDYERQYEKETLTYLGNLTGTAYSADIAQIFLNGLNSNPGEIIYFAENTEFGHDYTGITPIIDGSGNAIAVLAVDIPINDLYSVVENYIKISLIQIVILLIIIVFIMSKWMEKEIVNPIIKLKESARGFVESSRGQNDPNLIEFTDPEINSEDEMQTLSESLVTMAGDIKEYMANLMKETREKERIGTELELATSIQADMLPNIFPAFPEREDIDIFASMTPAKEVGGDFYDFFLIDDDHLGMVIADVSGKGVPAALFMMMSKILVNNFGMMCKSPAEALMNANTQICKSNANDMFVTAWFGILTISTGHVVASNAGHEYPVIKTAKGQFEIFKDKHKMPLGSMDGIKYQDYEFTLERGGGIFVYTDGVAEATNSENELFGMERTLDALNSNADAGVEDILKNVREKIDEFVGDAPQFDDLTMMAVKLK
ncbi:PP2C family protein-serine/threonine phosphatase [Lachnospiraceae bacterium C1.1]|nr:PP2C family protein-serine/threonine phosphatase [Lachnospiraceae bacterium C1.1]